MRDQARREKLKSRIHSLEHQSLKLQKQLRDVNHTLCRLLDEIGSKERVKVQNTDREKLS
ncbi:MAG: hypothetical protein PVG47_06350 [Chromatiales bacterium]|jgi:hypothetical protein